MALAREEPKDRVVRQPRFTSGSTGSVKVFVHRGASKAHAPTVADQRGHEQGPSRMITYDHIGSRMLIGP